MAYSELRGRYYQVKPDTINLHNLIGAYSGKHWIMSMLIDSEYVEFEVAPAPVSAGIHEVITQDFLTGKGRLIASIHVTNRTAVRLFLEGVLTFEHFAQAVEQGNTIYIQNFPFSGGLYTLIIDMETVMRYDYATLDLAGRVL